MWCFHVKKSKTFEIFSIKSITTFETFNLGPTNSIIEWLNMHNTNKRTHESHSTQFNPSQRCFCFFLLLFPLASCLLLASCFLLHADVDAIAIAEPTQCYCYLTYCHSIVINFLISPSFTTFLHG